MRCVVTESGETLRAVFSNFNYPEQLVYMDVRLSKNAKGRGKRQESLCNTNLSFDRREYWNLLRHISECLEIYSSKIAFFEIFIGVTPFYKPVYFSFNICLGTYTLLLKYTKLTKLTIFTYLTKCIIYSFSLCTLSALLLCKEIVI